MAAPRSLGVGRRAGFVSPVRTLSASLRAIPLPDAQARAESLPRRRIVRRRSLFSRVRLEGRRRVASSVQLALLASRSEGDGVVAFVTPRSLGLAVTRNGLRRRMREIYRRELAASQRPGTVCVWTARPEP